MDASTASAWAMKWDASGRREAGGWITAPGLPKRVPSVCQLEYSVMSCWREMSSSSAFWSK